MKVDIDLGQERLDVQVSDEQVVSVRREPPAPPIADVVAAIGTALETPVRFPPLRQALTPDDQVTVVLDELLPVRPELLLPVFEHLARAQIGPAAVTLLCPTEELKERWKSSLPEAARGARLEAHDPHDRKQLRYLATTEGGRRIYLNRPWLKPISSWCLRARL